MVENMAAMAANPPAPPLPVVAAKPVAKPLLAAQDALPRKRPDRLFLHAKAELRLKKGTIFHGRAQDLRETGVTFFPSRDVENIELGDRGILSFILEGMSKEFFTEFPSEVVGMGEENVILRFYDASQSKPGTMRPGDLKSEDLELIRPGAKVIVRRQGGKYEEGWMVLPPEAPLPVNIQQVLKQKEQDASCLVCFRKSLPGSGEQDLYKVYETLDLLAIQLHKRLGI